MPKGIYIRTEETRKILSLAKIGKPHPHSNECKMKLSLALKGKKKTKEHIEKMANSKRGKKLSLKTRLKMSLAIQRRKIKFGYINSLETRKKISIALSGSKNKFWMGGRTLLHNQIRNLFEYRQWRSDVFNRDKFSCLWCGDSRGGNLQADHIKPISLILQQYEITNIEQAKQCEELWNINNGRTLCKKCHQETNTYSGKSKGTYQIELPLAI